MSMGRGYRNYNYRTGGNNSSRGQSYRNSNYNNRMHGHMRINNDRYGNQGSGSSRYNSTGYHSGGSANNLANHGSGHHYNSRNRDRFDNNPSTSHNRHNDAGRKRSYRDNSRDRTSDRKKSRSDDYRRNTASSAGRSQNTPPPPPPTISSGVSTYRQSGNNVRSNVKTSRYNERNNSNIRHRTSPMTSSANRSSFRTNFEGRSRGVTAGRGSNMRSGMRGGSIRVTRHDGSDVRIIRRKGLRNQHSDRLRAKLTRLSSGIRHRRYERGVSRSPRRTSKRSSADYVEPKRNKRKSSISDGEKLDSMTKEVPDVGNENAHSKRGSSCRSGGSADRDKHKSTSLSSLQKVVDNYTEAGGVNTDEENNDNKLWGDEIKAEKKEGKKQDSSYKADDNKHAKREHIATARQIKCKEEDKKSVTGSSTSGTNINRRYKREAVTPTDDRSSDENNSSTRKKDSENKPTMRSSKREEQNKNTPQRRSAFIKLTCVHCQIKCVTFKEYSYHLNTRTHKAALRQIALRQRTHLLRLRARQRAAQREIEGKCKDVYDSKFCHLCRLHYRLPKAKHQLSEHHKIMKKFLMPYCSICHLAFKSPMLYETHRCSIEHIKVDRALLKNKSRKEEWDTDEDRVPNARDLEKFMTVDSVGQIDGAEESDRGDSACNEPTEVPKMEHENDDNVDDEDDDDEGEDGEEEEEDEDDDEDDDDEEDDEDDEDDDENGQDDGNTEEIYYSRNASIKPESTGSTGDKEEEANHSEYIGSGYVREITVFYCKICNRYCTAKCTLEEYIKQHCTEKDHVDAYWNNKQNQDNTQNEGKENSKSSNIINQTAIMRTSNQQNPKTNNSNNFVTIPNQNYGLMDGSRFNRPQMNEHVEKLWADVDRDLAKILKTLSRKSK